MPPIPQGVKMQFLSEFLAFAALAARARRCGLHALAAGGKLDLRADPLQIGACGATLVTKLPQRAHEKQRIPSVLRLSWQ